MIYVVGDLHGDLMRLATLKKHLTQDDTVIQVGDFGFYPEVIKEWKSLFEDYPCRILAVDGNHEDFNYIATFEEGIHNVVGNLFYVPRGSVLDIEGKLFGFLGGGESIDKAYRVENVSWWKQETITDEDVVKLIDNVNYRVLDYLIAHSAPTFTINAHFGPLNLRDWGLPGDWTDVSAQQISRAVHTLSPRNFICGHMHRSVIDGNIRILDINEVITIGN